MKMEYRQRLKFKIPNSKQCLVFDAWDLEFKQEELFSHEIKGTYGDIPSF